MHKKRNSVLIVAHNYYICAEIITIKKKNEEINSIIGCLFD